jgi:AcrR family transcriptional regulator
MTISEPPTTDRRRQRGDRTRRAILEAAARLAGVEGLEGLSIGRLASHLEMSKSGLFAHFRSKEELQLATIRTVMEMYDEAMVTPALQHPPGRDRLLRFVDLYLDYLRDGPLPGGCFFIASSLDPARLRDRVRDLLAENQAQLLGMFEECVREAQRAGETSAEGDPRDIAFAIDGLLIGADLNFVLFGNPEYLELGRNQVRRLLA